MVVVAEEGLPLLAVLPPARRPEGDQVPTREREGDGDDVLGHDGLRVGWVITCCSSGGHPRAHARDQAVRGASRPGTGAPGPGLARCGDATAADPGGALRRPRPHPPLRGGARSRRAVRSRSASRRTRWGPPPGPRCSCCTASPRGPTSTAGSSTSLATAGRAGGGDRPGRLRPLGQARRGGRPLLRPPRRVGARGGGRPRARRPRAARPGLGRADRAAAGRRGARAVPRRPRRQHRPAHRRRRHARAAGGSSGGRWSAPRPSTSGGSSPPAARAGWPRRPARPTTPRSPTRPTRRVRGRCRCSSPPVPTIRRPRPTARPGRRSAATTGPSSWPSPTPTRSPAAMGPVLREHVPGAARTEHAVVRDAGHFLQEDAGARARRPRGAAGPRGHPLVHTG